MLLGPEMLLRLLFHAVSYTSRSEPQEGTQPIPTTLQGKQSSPLSFFNSSSRGSGLSSAYTDGILSPAMMKTRSCRPYVRLVK